MNGRWDWWNQETEEEKILKALIVKAGELGRLPTVQEISDDPRVPRLYEISRVFGSIERAFERVAGLLFGSSLRTYPTELIGKQKLLSAAERAELEASLRTKFLSELVELQKPGELRKRLQSYTPKPVEKVTIIPARQRVRLSEFIKHKQAQQIATAAVAQTVQAVIKTIEEDTKMPREPQFTREDALETLRQARDFYGAVPTQAQIQEFALSHPGHPKRLTIVRLLGSSREWGDLLTSSSEDTPVGANAASEDAPVNTGVDADICKIPVPLAEASQETTPASMDLGSSSEELNISTEAATLPDEIPPSEVASAAITEPQLVAMKLKGELEIDLNLHGQDYRITVQLG